MEKSIAFTPAPAQQQIPVVLTQAEVRALLSQMHDRAHLMAALMHGTGMRLMECVRLRVPDINFGYLQATVRAGKDRVVSLVEKLILALQVHLCDLRSVHRDDLATRLAMDFNSNGCGDTTSTRPACRRLTGLPPVMLISENASPAMRCGKRGLGIQGPFDVF
jgi:integrase